MTRVLLLAVALFATPTLAQGEKGDPAAGKLKAYTCTGCHGVTGWRNAYPNYHVPRIAGQHYEYLIAALTGYKTGERMHPTMQAQGESLTDEDIRDIAAYVSGLTAKKGGGR
ncbi:MAG: cytochrome c [Dokdonella sp.]